MSRAQLLYQLQALDSEMDKAKQQLVEVAANLGESKALQEARTVVEVAQKNLRQAQTTMQDLELEVKGLTTKIATHEQKLYSGKVLNAKEAANLQEEVASLKRWRTKREELLLEAMVEVEEIGDRLKQEQAALATVQAAWANDQENLNQTQQLLKAKIAELKTQRPVMTKIIAPNDLSNYEALRPKKAGRAVAVVKDGVCQGCGMTASSSDMQRARTGAELSYCGACGRILYVL